MALTAVLCLAWLRSVHMFVERPTSSLLNHFEPYATFASFALKHTVRTFLGAFGAGTPKPIIVDSDRPEVTQLLRSEPKHGQRLAEHVSKGGKKRVNGKKKALSESQAYPVGFGVAVAKLFKQIVCG